MKSETKEYSKGLEYPVLLRASNTGDVYMFFDKSNNVLLHSPVGNKVGSSTGDGSHLSHWVKFEDQLILSND